MRGKFDAIKHLCYESFTGSHKELMPPWSDLVIFKIWRDARRESWNQFLKISNHLKTCSISFPGVECLSLHFEFPSGGVEGWQLQQQRVQSPLQRGRWQMLLLLFSRWQMLLASVNLQLTCVYIFSCIFIYTGHTWFYYLLPHSLYPCLCWDRSEGKNTDYEFMLLPLSHSGTWIFN